MSRAAPAQNSSGARAAAARTSAKLRGPLRISAVLGYRRRAAIAAPCIHRGPAAHDHRDRVGPRILPTERGHHGRGAGAHVRLRATRQVGAEGAGVHLARHAAPDRMMAKRIERYTLGQAEGGPEPLHDCLRHRWPGIARIRGVDRATREARCRLRAARSSSERIAVQRAASTAVPWLASIAPALYECPTRQRKRTRAPSSTSQSVPLHSGHVNGEIVPSTRLSRFPSSVSLTATFRAFPEPLFSPTPRASSTTIRPSSGAVATWLGESNAIALSGIES